MRRYFEYLIIGEAHEETSANSAQGNAVVRSPESNSGAWHAQRRRGGSVMSQTKQERNKALVFAAFDTLFNKRDYVAAER
jgi:hypothetical protein